MGRFSYQVRDIHRMHLGLTALLKVWSLEALHHVLDKTAQTRESSKQKPGHLCLVWKVWRQRNNKREADPTLGRSADEPSSCEAKDAGSKLQRRPVTVIMDRREGNRR